MNWVIFFVLSLVFFAQVNCQFWNLPREIYESFSWLRQGKTRSDNVTTILPPTATTLVATTNTFHKKTTAPIDFTDFTNRNFVTTKPTTKSEISQDHRFTTPQQASSRSFTTPFMTTTFSKTTNNPVFTTVEFLTTFSPITKRFTTTNTATTEEEHSTLFDTTLQDVTGTTEEPRDNHRLHDYYLNKREKPIIKIASNISQNLLPLPAGASAALVKPTKYHYYPHNQHIYLLPECAVQQVCNAVYVRLNWTQPLCACPSRYRDPCSASLNSDDQHTTELLTDPHRRRALTLVKTCEPTTEMRMCRIPRDWSLLALQNIRTGKSHYLVICRCPESSILEGPMSHDQPTYASVPGIRVYGMMCVQGNRRRGRPLHFTDNSETLSFPWQKVSELLKSDVWN